MSRWWVWGSFFFFFQLFSLVKTSHLAQAGRWTLAKSTGKTRPSCLTLAWGNWGGSREATRPATSPSQPYVSRSGTVTELLCSTLPWGLLLSKRPSPPAVFLSPLPAGGTRVWQGSSCFAPRHKQPLSTATIWPLGRLVLLLSRPPPPRWPSSQVAPLCLKGACRSCLPQPFAQRKEAWRPWRDHLGRVA